MKNGERSPPFFILNLLRVLLNFRFCVRVIYIGPFHRLNLHLQVLECNEQRRYNKDLQNHTD